MVFHPKLNVNFVNGLTFFKNLQVYCPLIEIFVYILYFLGKRSNKEEFQKYLIQISYSDCLIIYKNLSKSKSNSQKIHDFLEIINGFGMGEIKFDYRKNSKYYFKSQNLKMSLTYKKLFNKYPEVVLEYFLLGFLKNFFEILFEKEIKFKLTSYGFIYYSIEIDVKENLKKKKVEKLNYKFPKEKHPTSSQVKKFCVGDSVMFKNGEIKFWGAYSLNLPIYSLLHLFKILSEKQLKEEILALAQIQAYNSLESQKKLFGFKKDLFYNCMWKGEIIGMGKVNQTLNYLYLFNNFKFLGQTSNLNVELFCRYIEEILFVTYSFTNQKNCTFLKINDNKFKIISQKNKPELSKKAKKILTNLSFAKTLN